MMTNGGTMSEKTRDEMKTLRAHLAEMRHMAEDVSDLSQSAQLLERTHMSKNQCTETETETTAVRLRGRHILPSVCHHKRGVDRPQISPKTSYSQVQFNRSQYTHCPSRFS